MLAISAAELAEAAPLGVKAPCPKCGKRGPVLTAEGKPYHKKKNKDKTELAFVKCCGEYFFVGIDGVKI